MLRIYGVIDLKSGQVVRAAGGRRDAYRPVTSILSDTSQPGDVAHGLARQLGIRHAYVADLDAIAGAPPDLAALEAIASTGLELLVDAGVGGVERATQMAEFQAYAKPLAGIVVGLESVCDATELADIARAIGPQRAVFSLDSNAGQPLAICPQLRDKSLAEIGDIAWHATFRRLIVLDLASVGSGAGPTTGPLCASLRSCRDWSELISGGGVRNASRRHPARASGVSRRPDLIGAARRPADAR